MPWEWRRDNYLPPQLKHSNVRPASAASHRLPERKRTVCPQLILEDLSWLRRPATVIKDHAGDLLSRLWPTTYQLNWPTGLLLFSPLPATGENQATGVYTLTIRHRPAPEIVSFIRHMNAGFIIWTDGAAPVGTLNGGNRRRLHQSHDLPHEATAWFSFYLIIRRRERGNALGALAAPTFTWRRGHIYWQPIGT